MNINKDKVMSGLLWGLFAELLNKVSPLLIALIAARALASKDFGLAQVSLWGLDYILFFVACGVGEFGPLYLAKNAKNREDYAEFLSSAFLVRLCFGGIVWALMQLPHMTEGFSDQSRQYWMLLSFLGIAASIFDASSLLIATHRTHVIAIVNIIVRISGIALAALFVRSPGDSLIFLTITLGTGFMTALGTSAVAWRYFGYQSPSRKCMTLLLAAAPVFVTRVILLLSLERFDLFTLYVLGRFQDLGVYVAPLRMVLALLPIVTMSSQVFLADILSQNSKDKTSHKHLWLAVRWCILVFTPIIFIFWIFGGDLCLRLLGDSYALGNASSLLGIFALGALAQACLQIIGYQIFLVQGRIWQMNVIVFISLTFGLIIFVFFGQDFSLIQFATVSVFCKCLAAVLLILTSLRQIRPIPLDLLRVSAPLVLFASAEIVFNYGLGLSPWFALLVTLPVIPMFWRAELRHFLRFMRWNR